MATNYNVEAWLAISRSLVRGLLPKDSGPEFLKHGLNAEDFAALVDRETTRVDEALVAMALAKGEAEVKAIAAELSRDTLIVLASRWTVYYKTWEKHLRNPDPPLWMPPGRKDLWRAIFLAMTQEDVHSTAALSSLWTEFF